ncbi:hypothetical protein C9994_13895 [Marivirga lumbricoides]|uniref:Uncharacterized protein n=1 Tax=Marivirga lumbricoides TaxID=1046115 RepID=A0A2T4DFL4_9BACT|nr:hypothetical protein C9994_13895 [Marivirga lumbricoides]
MNILFNTLIIFATVLLLIYFIIDFNLNNKRSLGILFGLSAIGGVSFVFLKKQSFLKELELRRNEISSYRAQYALLMKEGVLESEEYKDRLEEFDATEKEAYISILKANGSYKENLIQEYNHLPSGELYKKVVENIKSEK